VRRFKLPAWRSPGWAEPIRVQVHRLPAPMIGLGALVVAQAGWLVLWCERGWFYQDDFDYMDVARRSPFNWSYLMQHTGGHLIPGFWLFAWLLAHLNGLHFLPTVIFRLVLQAIATVLLYRVVHELCSSTARSLAIVAMYCASPLIVPASLYLSQSVVVLPAQIFSLVAYLAILRHHETRSLRSSLLAGIALLLTAVYWEKTAIDTMLVIVVLVIGWLTPGGPWARAKAVLRDWKGWLLTLAPLGGFGVIYLTHHYDTGATGHTPLLTELHLGWIQWSRDICLALIGGPWHWGIAPEVFTGFSTPSHGAIIAGQVAFGLLTVLLLWLYGWRRILIWLLPAVPVVLGTAVVAAGRYSFIGNVVGLDYHYAFDLAIPLALALALAWRPEGRRQRRAGRRERSPAGRRVLAPALGVVVVASVIASSAVSVRRWTDIWHRNQAKAYVTTLFAQYHQRGQPPVLYDTFVPQTVVPGIDAPLSLSKLFKIAMVKASFDSGPTDPELVDAEGHIVAATFTPSSTADVAAKPVCPTLISGVQSVTLPLDPPLPFNYYFLRLQYFENAVSNVTVTVHTKNGRPVTVAGGNNVQLGQAIGQQVFKLTRGAPASVTIAGTTAATNLCASLVTVGYPTEAQQ
jgi:hypothetical protein